MDPFFENYDADYFFNGMNSIDISIPSEFYSLI
jgi:hypothetical protein